MIMRANPHSFCADQVQFEEISVPSALDIFIPALMGRSRRVERQIALFHYDDMCNYSSEHLLRPIDLDLADRTREII
jgi:hypothetical protein